MVLVSPENGVISLSVETIARIFAGQITDWAELGRPAGRINVYAPTPDSGTFDTFDSLVLKPRKLKLTDKAKRTENHAEQADWVADDPLGIGVTGIAYQRGAKAVNLETSCRLLKAPSTFTIKTEEYPLSRRLYLYTDGQPRSELGRGLLSFALSPAAQPIVKANDFIDQSPEAIGYDAQAPRIIHAFNAPAEDFDERLMRALMTEISKMERLSATFRFDTASFQLDNKALADIQRLRDLIESGELRGKKLLLAGFADSRGGFPSNLRLSEQRANAVLRAIGPIRRDADVEIVARGFSENAPTSCNDTPEGQQFNRRVEVWVGR